MSKDATPNFRVNVYGSDPNKMSDIERDMLLGGGRGGGNGGGLPWFHRSSPTYPNNAGNATPPPLDADIEPWELTPYANGPANVPPGTAGDGGVGGLFAGMSAQEIAALLLSLSGTVGGALSKPPNTNPSSATSDPAMQELLSLMSGRLKKSEPLYDSVVNMANGLLPTQYQKGGGGMP